MMKKIENFYLQNYGPGVVGQRKLAGTSVAFGNILSVFFWNIREIKIHVDAKRLSWICTTWPTFPLIVVYFLLLLLKNK